MDFLDILITVVIIGMVLLGNVSKLKKKYSSVSKTTVASEPDWVDEDLSYEEESYEDKLGLENEKFETNSSKSQSYFTYETVSESDVPMEPSQPSSFQKSNENHLQEVENEIETSNLDLHDPNELKKAVLYGEILKNPYN